MTQDELDALPEDGSIILMEQDGRMVPEIRTVGALWTSDDEPCTAVDAEGTRWMLGWHNGVRYKRRMSRA